MAGPVAVCGDHETFDSLIWAAVEQIGDREAYVEVATGRRLTFAEWVEAGSRVANHLRRRGIGPGDVVAVAVPPSIDFAIGVLGAVLAGAVVTGINHRLGPREIAGIFDRCHPGAVLLDEAISVPVGHEPLLLRRAELEVLAHPPEGEPLPAIANGVNVVNAEVVRPEDPVVIIWTSGTTGVPKGAWFDHRNLAAAVSSAGEMTRAFDRRISGIPFAHAGYLAKLWEQFAMGVTLVLTPTPWSAATMLEVLTSERITVGAGVPTQWAKLLELPDVARADLSALRICLAATAPAAPELVERMTDVIGAPVVVRYAMTECPSITGTAPDDTPAVQYRTVERPQPGTTVRLVDDHGDDVAHGQVGTVLVRGPCVMRGYWNDPERTAEVLDGPSLRSGDLGRFDDQGNLVLVGRAGDMYIRGGYNVYPLEIENVLAEHPEVAAAAVIGVPAPTIGEVGVAFVVPAIGASPTRDELRRWIGERLADYKAPDEIRLLEALPLTAMAKVDKIALRSAWDRSVGLTPRTPQ